MDPGLIPVVSGLGTLLGVELIRYGLGWASRRAATRRQARQDEISEEDRLRRLLTECETHSDQRRKDNQLLQAEADEWRAKLYAHLRICLGERNLGGVDP